MSAQVSFDPTSPRLIDQRLAHYAQSHRHPINERIHFVCVPLIVFSLLGMLSAVHPFAAYAFVGASLVYYIRLSIPFLAAMSLMSAIMLALLTALGDYALPVSIVVFVLAWIGQFIGHALEGKRPSFFEDVRYLWIGPLFCLSFLFRKLGIAW